MKALPVLYGLDKNGGIKQWRVSTVEDTITVIHGKQGGKSQTRQTVCKPKNVGRSNETTAEQQAESEAQSKWNKQWDKGYRNHVDLLDELPKLPMLAHDYRKQGHRIKFPCHVSQKLDGCFTGGTKIWTEKGLIPIRKIVDEKMAVKVWSYNEETKQRELKKVVNHFNNGVAPSSEFMSYTVEGAPRVTCTYNHKVYTQRGWIEAGCLDESSDKVLAIKNAKRLQGALLGNLIGDSMAVIDKRSSGVSWHLTYATSNKDIDYGLAKQLYFSNICSFREKRYTSGYGSECTSFTGSAVRASLFDLSMLYDVDHTSVNYGKRKKVISYKDLNDTFTDETLAFWYFDDGSLHKNNDNPLTPRMFISVAGLSDETIENLTKVLKNRYNVEPSFAKYGRDKRLAFTSKDTIYLQFRISKALPSTLVRKLSIESTDVLEPLDVGLHYLPIQTAGANLNKSTKYDIEVEDNHNYFAEGTLVHNCRAMAHIDVEGSNVRLVSRGGKDYPIPHALKDKLLSVGINTGHTLLDGELYIHGMKLQDIISCVKKPNENTANLEFVIFDLPCEETPWSERYEKLLKLHEDTGSKIVANYIASDEVDLMEWHTVFTGTGYEGAMLRNLDSKYQYGKRDAGLQKYKEFLDSEFLVLDVELDKNNEPVWQVGEHGNGGVAFKVKMVGSSAERVKMWEDRHRIIGDYMTVKYQALTKDGIPQFPVGIAIRNYE